MATASNANTLSFPKCTVAAVEVELFFGLGTASSGAGKLLMSAPLGSLSGPFVAEADDDTIICKGHGLQVDDRCAVMATVGKALPGNVAAGTVYWVKTVSGDTITISTTQGGAAVNISSDGAGELFKVVRQTVDINITPKFAAGALTIPSVFGEISGDILGLLLNNTTIAGIGDVTGLVGSSADGNLYLSLHTADPAGGNQTTNEAAYASYDRVAVARDGTQWTIA